MFGMNQGTKHLPSVAILSDKQLGDVTLLEPLSRLLARQSGAPVGMHVNESFKPLVELMPHAVWGPDFTGSYTHSWTTSWSSRAAFRSWSLTSRKKHLLINQGRHWRWWYRLIFHEAVTVSTPGEYWAMYFWRALGGEVDEFQSSRLNTPPESWCHPELPEKPYVLINPTAAWPTKYWLADRWAQVMRNLAAEMNFTWVMTGGGSPPERAHCAEIAALAGVELTDLSARTSLKQYIHGLSRARLVLCVDGSASHLAQAFGVPTITLFGPVFERRWHWPTSQNRVVSAFQHVQGTEKTTADISVAIFADECRALLRNHPNILHD